MGLTFSSWFNDDQGYIISPPNEERLISDEKLRELVNEIELIEYLVYVHKGKDYLARNALSVLCGEACPIPQEYVIAGRSIFKVRCTGAQLYAVASSLRTVEDGWLRTIEKNEVVTLN